MPTKQKPVRILGIVALLCVAASTAHCKDAVFVQGIVFRTCAPYDGAALEARIPTVSGNQVVVIHVNESLGTKSFSRPITGISQPGGAAVRLCQREGEDPRYPGVPLISYSSCVEASSGSVEIGAVHGSMMAGHLDVRYTDDKRMNADFSARVLENPKGRGFCG
jgi:hypothetical protein